jgi:hypothetical protein
MDVDLLIYFMKERESIRIKKDEGLPKPWTKDPILQQYKFTNIHREDDRVSRWVAENWREPYSEDFDVWFAMAVAVMSNKIEAMEAMGYPVPWNAQNFDDTMTKYGFGNAYMLTTHCKPIRKPAYYAWVLSALWHNKEALNPRNFKTLVAWHENIILTHGVGSFLGGQIIAAAKHTLYPEHYTDFRTFVAPGPGSLRGLNRICQRPVDKKWDLVDFRERIADLNYWVEAENIGMDFQDLQNCLCEYDKYCRVYYKESGRLKHLYNGRG